MENPGEIHLVAVGPLTNVAMAFLREPQLSERLAHLTIMAGVIRGTADLQLPYVEHNVRCDPEAAHVVLSSGAPITLVPLDVTTKVRITPEGVDRIRSAETAFNEAVARQVDMYPRFAEQGYTYLHDPLAVAAVVAPSLLNTKPLCVEVELGGRHTAGATLVRTAAGGESPNTQVALGVDAEAFEEFFLTRIEGTEASVNSRG
jgi:purine nucleosidase